MALLSYQQQVQRLLHDANASFYSLTDINAYINTARGQVAAEGRCLRLLLSGGVITGITNLVGGAGYTAATTVTFTGSGQQAFATPTIAGGVITAITITSGGWGFLTAPTVVITDTGGGAGASATATVDNSATTVAGQEVFKFSTLNTLAALTAGVQAVLGAMSIAAQWGAGNSYKPTLDRMVWSQFQAYCRIWSNSAQSFPSVWATYGVGGAGSFYLFPIPSQALSLDIDAYCRPINLVDDTTVEALPYPWTDAVQYYAAYLAFNNSQRQADSDRMFKQYETFMQRSRAQVESEFYPSAYEEA